MLPVSCVFFDAAGTLIRLREPVGEAYARIAARHGIEVDPQSVETAFLQAWKTTPPLLHPDGEPPQMTTLLVADSGRPHLCDGHGSPSAR